MLNQRPTRMSPELWSGQSAGGPGDELSAFPPTAAPMTGLHLTGHDVRSGEQGRRAVAFAAVAETIHRFDVRKPEEALGSFQRLGI